MMTHLILLYSEIQKLEKEKEHIRTEANKTRDELKSAEVLHIAGHLLFEYIHQCHFMHVLYSNKCVLNLISMCVVSTTGILIVSMQMKYFLTVSNWKHLQKMCQNY